MTITNLIHMEIGDESIFEIHICYNQISYLVISINNVITKIRISCSCLETLPTKSVQYNLAKYSSLTCFIKDNIIVIALIQNTKWIFVVNNF